MNDQNPPKFYTTKEAGEVLGIQAGSVLTNIDRGNLPAQKFGKQWMISEADLMRFKNNRPRQGRPSWKVEQFCEEKVPAERRELFDTCLADMVAEAKEAFPEKRVRLSEAFLNNVLIRSLEEFSQLEA